MAQLVRSVSWFSSPRQHIRSNVATMSCMAACWALESMSSSYRVKALCVCVCVCVRVCVCACAHTENKIGYDHRQ